MSTSHHYFFIVPAPTLLYTLSLHDALPISARQPRRVEQGGRAAAGRRAGARRAVPQRAVPALGDRAGRARDAAADRKSTRLNSSHLVISYAVFCLKKKK